MARMPRPVSSPDGRYVAWITPDAKLHVSVLPSDVSASSKTKMIQLAANIQTLLMKVQHLCWSSPTSSRQYAGRVDSADSSDAIVSLRLMLASDYRIVVLELEAAGFAPSSIEVLGVLVDVEFPVHYGKISAIDFAFDHDSAIIMFELAAQASILSLIQAQRDDIPNRKFSTPQGYSLRHRCASTESVVMTSVLALLVRDKCTDYVVVMESGSVVSTFKPDTIDAQGVMWSPDEKPMLVVWDSPAYGTKLNFFSALGHPLRQLDIDSTSVPADLSLDFLGTGVSAVHWIKKAGSRTTTLIVVGNGSKQIIFRSQDSQSLATESHYFRHPTALHSSTTKIWQHVSDNTYRPVEGVWDLDKDSTGEIELAAISSDGQRVASKVHGAPNVAFIWGIKQGSVLAVIIFQKEVRQLIWDEVSLMPIIVTGESTPSFHYWYDLNEPPLQVTPPCLKGLMSSRWEGRLLLYGAKTNSKGSLQDHSLFMMSSTKYMDVVRLDGNGFPSTFDASNCDGHDSFLSHRGSSNIQKSRSTQPATSSIR